MPRKPVNNNAVKRKKQIRLAIGLSVLLALSIIVIIGVILLEYQQKPTASYARDINDASYDCENKIENHYEEDLVSKVYDNFSSRYEPEKRQYVIYYRVSINSEIDGQPAIIDYMVKCIVWERLGYVSEFQILNFFDQ